MKKAFVEQILIWILLFVSFASIFFFVLDYYTAIKIQDKSNALAQYVARTKGLSSSHADIIEGLNFTKGDAFDIIVDEDLVCDTDGATSQYQIIVDTSLEFKSRFIPNNENIVARAISFNEINATNITCTLALRVKE